MADSSPYNTPYACLHNEGDEHQLTPLQPPPTGFNQTPPPTGPNQQPANFQSQQHPPPQTGLHYYTQPYPAAIQAQPQMPVVATQQTTDTSTKLPKYAFVTSVVATIIFTVLFWLPGFLCLIPATVMSIMALSKKEDNKLKEAKQFSIISFSLVLIFAISYPILVTTVILASVFGYMCDYVPRQSSYYGNYYFSRPYACG